MSRSAARLGLLGGAQRIARDAAAHVLVADRLRHDRLRGPWSRPAMRELAQHVVLHERQDFAEVLVLVMVGVDVDDQHVVELALHRLLARVREQLGWCSALRRRRGGRDQQ